MCAILLDESNNTEELTILSKKKKEIELTPWGQAKLPGTGSAPRSMISLAWGGDCCLAVQLPARFQPNSHYMLNGNHPQTK